MTIFVAPLYSFVTYSFPIRLYHFIVVQYAMPPCIVSFFKLLIPSFSILVIIVIIHILSSYWYWYCVWAGRMNLFFSRSGRRSRPSDCDWSNSVAAWSYRPPQTSCACGSERLPASRWRVPGTRYRFVCGRWWTTHTRSGLIYRHYRSMLPHRPPESHHTCWQG